MVVDATASYFSYRLCRRIGLIMLAGIIGIEACVLVFIHGLYQSDTLQAFEKTTKSAVSTLYANSPDQAPDVLLSLSRTMVERGTLSGGILSNETGGEIGRFGEIPDRIGVTGDGNWLDVRWTNDQLGVPYTLTARLDTSSLRPNLDKTFWLIGGLAVLLTLCLAVGSMAVFRRKVVSPLAEMGNNLLAASQSLTNVQQFTIAGQLSDDELGDAISAANRLLEQISLSHRDSLYTVKTMADRAAVAILTYDETGKVHYANQACFRLCDLRSLEDMQAAGLPKFEFANETAPQSLPESTITGPYSRDAILIGRDGKRSAVVVNAAKVPEDSKSEVRYYASITDITELRIAEQRLKQQNVELETANRAKSQFLANMSHELRTPLNAIIGFSEMFVNSTFGPLGSEHYQEYAKDIHNSGNHLLGIINDILDLSKIEAGQMELREAQLDVAQIVNSAVRIVHERAANAELKLVTQLPDQLPKLNADERGVKQMLINLLSNAIKFTDAGGTITIGADCRNGALLLGVADTGIGMSKDDAIVAMKPFGQVDSSNTRKYEGTGLGLPLVKSLIELHGGRIRIDSGQKRGTTVTLTFPQERTVNAGPGEEAA